jgi:RimJ/RimL family protein N-acetyltransferase
MPKHIPKGERKRPRTSSVLLQDVVDGDLTIFYEQQHDPEATQMAAFPARDKEAFSAHWTKILADKNNIIQTILFEGQVAGNIVSWDQAGQQQIGYWIGREFWGKGIATRALSEFLGYVKVRPLYAYVAKHNIASIRVLEKNGFSMIGEDKFFSSAQGEEVEELLLKLS